MKLAYFALKLQIFQKDANYPVDQDSPQDGIGPKIPAYLPFESHSWIRQTVICVFQ